LPGEAGEQGAGLPGEWCHPAVLIELQRFSQAGLGLVERPGQPRHLRLCHQELGQFRRAAPGGEHRHRLLRQPRGGAVLAAPGEHLRPCRPPAALDLNVAGPGEFLGFLGQPQRLVQTPLRAGGLGQDRGGAFANNAL
jgi:hypothetical protein